jgi:hypothetical protein
MKTTTIRLFLFCLCLCASALVAGGTGGSTTHTYATALRPTLVPLPMPPDGAHIRTLPPAGAAVQGLLAVVQWRDQNERWHDVTGWQSIVSGAPIRWWVAPEHFGRGPYRWVLHRGNSAQPALISNTFMLPSDYGMESLVGWE